MGRQLNQIIEGLSGVTAGTSTINVNLDAIEALLTTLQADVADGIIVSSGTANSNLRDGSGNSLTSTVFGSTRRLDVNLSSAGTTGSAVPTTANLYAGTDGTNLRAVSVDASGRLNTNTLDGLGNAITSTTFGTSRRLDVNLASAGTTGSAVPTTANLYAGSDGANLRAISVDSSGRINSNITSGTLTTGTVTANIVPVRGTTTIGTLTAGTTNGTLFATNSTRNYLLVQCTSGTAFIDTNGTASTANGIQLTSGQGITFEGSFIPTGAIAAITSTGTAQLIGRQG